VSVLSLAGIEVGPSELEAVVAVTDERFMRTSAVAGLPNAARELLPGLDRHSCENDAGARFVDELRDTETPHLLEHVTVELMALAGSPRSLAARTTWDFARDGRGVFRLRIAYDDDLVALGALKEAVGVVDWLFGEGARPDVDAATARLRRLRHTP
jgi:hypothetical protein